MPRLIWGLVAVIVVLFVFFMLEYNGLVRLRQLMRNAWADVDVYLKRRAELIPNLVAAVKAYASHEQTVLSALAEARAKAAAMKGPTTAHAQAENEVAMSLVQVMAIAENYPDLQASGNFMDLQKELAETERLIASARQYYNAVVRDLNTKIESFPSNFVAGAMGMKLVEYFETETVEERIAPSVA